MRDSALLAKSFRALLDGAGVCRSPLPSAARATEEDKGVLANLISQALSSPTTTVSVGAVDGALSSNATIRDIVLSDRDGPWLKVDTVRLVWSRLALLQRRLQVDELTIDHLQFLRRPSAGGGRRALSRAQRAQGRSCPNCRSR